MSREAVIERTTSETSIRARLNLDGKGVSNIRSGIPFFDHMLTLFARHGLFDLDIDAKGDIEVDFHHTVEDAGITLGQALDQGARRQSGNSTLRVRYVPMDEALVRVVIDLSGRPLSRLRSAFSLWKPSAATFPSSLVEEFLRALSVSGAMNLHVEILDGRDAHHMAEAVFKALARALDVATQIDPRVEGVPSTKGVL